MHQILISLNKQFAKVLFSACILLACYGLAKAQCNPDTEAPVITCTPVALNADSGLCSATYNLVLPPVTDNCQMAGPEIDQSLTTEDNTWNTGGYYVAESFTAGISGVLQQVSLNIAGAGTGSIAILNGPDVCGQTLYSQNATFNTGWNNYTISGVTVQAGSVYTILINSTAGTAVYAFNNSDGQGIAYAGSTLWWAGCGNGINNVALDFQTTVNPSLYTFYSGNNFPVGNTPVTWYATDASGNVDTCVQTVSVSDNQAPVISSCPSDITSCSAFVSWTAPTAADNCGIASFTSNYHPGDSFPTGITTVTYTARDVNNNVSTCSFNVNVELGQLGITGVSTVCNQPVTLTAAGGSSYSWSGGSSPNTAVNTFASSGNYTVTVSNGGCSATISQVVTINPLPLPITITGSTTSCTSATLTASSPSFMGNIPCTGYNADVIANGPGYSQNSTSTDVDGVGNIFVSQDFNPGYGICAPGSDGLPLSGQITSTLGTGITYTLQNYSGNNDLRITNDSSGTLTLISPVTAGTLHVVCTGGNGSLNFQPTVYFSNGSSATLSSVFVSDWCNSQGNQLTGQIYFRNTRGPYAYCEGGDCQHLYEVAITNIPTASAIDSIRFANHGGGILNIFALGQSLGAGIYTWSGGTTPNSAANTFLTSGTYGVTATNSAGCSTAATPVTVTIDSTIISASGSTSICYGSTVTLTSSADSSYHWSDGETTQSITVNTSGTYSVTANGCAALNPVTVNVHPAPYISTNGPTTFCPGYSLLLIANPTGSYLWSTSQTSDSISVNTAGTFSVSITDTFGCTLDTSISTHVNSLPVPQLTSSSGFIFCPAYSPVNISITSPSPLYATYLWNDSTTNSSDNVSDSGEVSVTVSDALGCSVSASAEVISNVVGNPAVYGQGVWNVYAWNAGDQQIDANDWNQQYSGYYVDTNLTYNSTNYWCNYCSPSNAPGYLGCPVGIYNISYSAQRQGFPCGYYRIDIPAHDDAAQLFINGTLVWVDSVCCDVNLNVWRGILDANTQLMFRVSQGGGYTDGIMAITALPNDSIIVPSGATSLCNGQSVTLTASGKPPYLWNTGATTQSITVNQNGSYGITYADGGFCTVAAIIPVSVVTPVISGCSQNITVSVPAGVCGTEVSFDTPVASDVCAGLASVSFAFTGAYQTWTVPSGVTSINIDASGATGSGDVYYESLGGNGARVQTTIPVTPGQVLYINIGGTPSVGSDSGGYNGGGFPYFDGYGDGGGGGGGLTQIGLTGNRLTDTLLVAAGGGGGGEDCGGDNGGAGGGPNGTTGLDCGNADGGGATQSAGGTGSPNGSVAGSFMQGANGSGPNYSNNGGGGGGGYYGGGSGFFGGGGGGSSYVTASAFNTTYTTGYNANGNGYVNITYGVPFKATQTAGLPSGSTFPVGTTTVTFTATDSVGGSSSCSFTVTVNPTPVSASATICAGSSYNFNGRLLTQAGLYTDTISSSTGCDSVINLTLIVNPVPVSTITASGATTFCPGGKVTLTASTGTSYHWSTGATTQAIVAKTSGSYVVTVYNAFGCGTASSPTVVNETSNPIPTITASKSTTFCQGGNVVLTASTGTAYKWNTGATTKAISVTTSGSYIVTVNLAGGCSGASAPEVVTVNPLPTATVTAGGPTTFCKGDSVTLTATAGTGYSYLWSNGATANSISAIATGSYKVTITNASGCKGSSAITKVTVHPLPAANITAGSSTELCNGDSVRLTAKPGTAWRWSNGATARIITVRTAGNYDVTVTNNYGCSNSAAPVQITDCGTVADKTDGESDDGNTLSAITAANSFDVTVYPNPYTGQFHLKVLSSSTENINVKIYDITGKLLEEGREMPYGTDVILGSGYASGVYLVETNQGDNVKMTRVVKAE